MSCMVSWVSLFCVCVSLLSAAHFDLRRLGGVFLAAGMLPFLLSLPLILARITVKMLITEGGSWFSFETIRNCQFFVDTSHTLATL